MPIIARSDQKPEENRNYSFELFERLLFSSSYRDDQKEIILDAVSECLRTMDFDMMAEIEKELYTNQLDPIVYDFRYSQTDIVRHLKKLR